MARPVHYAISFTPIAAKPRDNRGSKDPASRAVFDKADSCNRSILWRLTGAVASAPLAATASALPVAIFGTQPNVLGFGGAEALAGA